MSPLAALGFFAALFFLPQSTRAAEGTTSPAAMQGVWSSPDCADSKKAWIISAHYFIHADAQDLSIDRITAWRKEDNQGDTLYAFEASNAENALLNRTNDGLMKMIRGDVKKDAPLTASWGWTQEEVAEEYSRCVKLFDTTPQMGQSEVNSIFLLDQALENCDRVSAEKFSGAAGAMCRKHLFDLVDTSRDKKLDRAELAVLERQLAFLNRGLQAQEESCAAPDKTLPDFLLPPGTNDIDLKDVLSAGETQPALWHKAGQLARLLPFLPAPEHCAAAQTAEMLAGDGSPPNTPIKTGGIKAKGTALPAPSIKNDPAHNIPGAKIRP